MLILKPKRLVADIDQTFNCWGNAIYWDNPSKFGEPLYKNMIFRVNGCKTPTPRVGQTMIASFEKSWMLFRFTKIWFPQTRDPFDMFFGEVELLDQEIK